MARTPFKRTDRVASLVRQVLGELLTFEVKDPRVRGAVITDVEITGDLREARVFVIPPEDAWAPIQAIRQEHDRGFRRWMPHIMFTRFRPIPNLAVKVPASSPVPRVCG